MYSTHRSVALCRNVSVCCDVQKQLAELEDRFKKAMMNNAQLDNEKQKYRYVLYSVQSHAGVRTVGSCHPCVQSARATSTFLLLVPSVRTDVYVQVLVLSLHIQYVQRM